MIVGNGIIAKAFLTYKENDEVLIFASGVSNSTNLDQAQFERERLLLRTTIKENPTKTLVYFSTCSILDPSVNNGAYVAHKIAMEILVKENASRYLIVRLSNIVGVGGNEKTLINYLYQAVQKEKAIELWAQAERNVLGQEDMVYIVSEILNNQSRNQTLNVASATNLKVVAMLQSIERLQNKKAIYSIIDKGNPLPIDTAAIAPYLKVIEAEKGTGILYFETLLANYYSI
jgi:nucleoside-diphosphate-sugar epimerase